MINFVNRTVNGKFKKTYFKFVMVLYGKQDVAKSTFLEKIGGEFYTEEASQFKFSEPRYIDMIVENALMEMGETGFFKRNDMEDIKTEVTRRQIKAKKFGDSSRKVYNARHVFVVTANKLKFMKDTELKRFALLHAGESDIEHPEKTAQKINDMGIDMIKGMFAQAWYLLNTVNRPWELPKELWEELAENRGRLQFRPKEYDDVALYVNSWFPIDTFTNHKPRDKGSWMQRHSWDWDVIKETMKDGWNYNEYVEAQKTSDGRDMDVHILERFHYSTATPETNPELFSKVTKVSVTELIQLMRLDTSGHDGQYVEKHIQESLEMLGFRPFVFAGKGKDRRGTSHFYKKHPESDLYVRDLPDLPPFIKP